MKYVKTSLRDSQFLANPLITLYKTMTEKGGTKDDQQNES